MILVGLTETKYPDDPVSIRGYGQRVIVCVKDFLKGKVVEGDYCLTGIWDILVFL
jgi:hypothetical protein